MFLGGTVNLQGSSRKLQMGVLTSLCLGQFCHADMKSLQQAKVISKITSLPQNSAFFNVSGTVLQDLPFENHLGTCFLRGILYDPTSISGITWTWGEDTSGLISGFITIKNSEEYKIFFRSKKVADSLGFSLTFWVFLLSFQEEPPLPSGKTSLEQHHWHLLMNVFPSQQTCLPGTYTSKHEFYSLTFKCMSFCFFLPTSTSFNLSQLM